mgnify:CR=1 FL=1
MKIGVCRGLDDFESIKCAAEAGLDYYECSFGSLVNFDDEKFQKCKAYLEENNLPCLVANGFLPGDLKVVGNNIDYDALNTYLDKGFERAKELGLKNSSFKNPHGLDEDGHYTSAYDLAKITAYALRNPVFKEIVSTKKMRTF